MELNKKKITEMIELRLVRQNSNSCTVSWCKKVKFCHVNALSIDNSKFVFD